MKTQQLVVRNTLNKKIVDVKRMQIKFFLLHTYN